MNATETEGGGVVLASVGRIRHGKTKTQIADAAEQYASYPTLLVGERKYVRRLRERNTEESVGQSVGHPYECAVVQGDSGARST